MKEVVFVVLAIAVAALVVVEVFLGLAGFEGNRGFICKKLFFAQKAEKTSQCKTILRTPAARETEGWQSAT